MATIGTQLKGTKIIGRVDDITFFDVKRFMARRAADLLFGQGIVVNSDKEEIKNYLTNLAQDNKLDDLLLQAAEDAAFGGRIVLTIDKTSNGEFMISYMNNELLQNIEKIEVTPFRATLMRRKVVGFNVFFITEIWDTRKVVRSVEVQDKNGQTIPLGEYSGEIPPELNIPAIEIHNLGFVPFIEITNKPARNIIITTADNSHMLQDDYVVRYMAVHINNGLIQWYKEEVLAKTRVFGNFTQPELNKLKNEDINGVLTDLVFSTKQIPNQSKPVEVAPGTFVDTPWTGAMKAKVNLFAIGCGYSPIFQESADQTEAESLLSKDADTRTTKAKRRRWSNELKDLFAKLLVYKGLATNRDDAKDKFTIEIKENVVYNQLQLTDFLSANVENGFMTRSEAIALQRDLDDETEADEILKRIEKDQDERADKQLEQDTKALEASQAIGQGNGGGVGAMGTNDDADPKNEEA